MKPFILKLFFKLNLLSAEMISNDMKGGGRITKKFRLLGSIGISFRMSQVVVEQSWRLMVDDL